ncbi:hypothetical protein L218DRAFT_948589 [Marasmius fiardii PR-910]|nr:hypothetical protein L218DRAFT_948589 [Marasmius fiardii PR-910]
MPRELHRAVERLAWHYAFVRVKAPLATQIVAVLAAKLSLEAEGCSIILIENKRFPLWGDDGNASAKDVKPFEPLLTPAQEAGRPAVVLHSSGSTGLPKAVYYHHQTLRSASRKVDLTVDLPCSRCIMAFGHFALSGENDEGVKLLSSFDSDDLGDRLTASGVNIVSAYGSSENWLRPLHHTKSFMFFGSCGAEFVMRGYPERDSYATKDVFQRHPEHADQYRYIGRLDDTLVHVSGKKTNLGWPVPILTMELAIRGDPYVSEAIVFGANKPQTGVLSLTSELGTDLLKDELVKKIWPVIETANHDAPSFFRIAPEMVEILPFDTHSPSIPKMTFIRPAALRAHTDQVWHNRRVEWRRIRNVIQRELKVAGGVVLRNTVVFEYPTVEKLAKHLISLTVNAEVPVCQPARTKMLRSRETSCEYPAENRGDDRQWEPKPSGSSLDRTTGALGAHVLRSLLASPLVQRVIFISRAATHADSRERVKKSLRLRKISVPEEFKWTSYAGNPILDMLGLSQREYDQIKAEVRGVIHNAWPVNFKLNIDSYDEHFRGCCQSYEPLSTINIWDNIQMVKEEFSHNPSTAMDMGYSQSAFKIAQLVGDTVHGIWNETEAPPLIFKSADVNGVLPLSITQWLLIDYGARGVAEIALSPPKPETTSANDILLLGLESAGLRLERVALADWVKKQMNSEKDPKKNPIVKLFWNSSIPRLLLEHFRWDRYSNLTPRRRERPRPALGTRHL